MSVLFKLEWGSGGCVCSLQTGIGQRWVCLFSSNWDRAAVGVSVLFLPSHFLILPVIPSLCFVMSLSVGLWGHVYIPSLSVRMSVSLCLFLSLFLSISPPPSVCLSVCLCLSVSLSLCVSVCLSLCLSVSVCLSLSHCVCVCVCLSPPLSLARACVCE